MKKLIFLLLISNSIWAQKPINNKYKFDDFVLIDKVEDQEKVYNEMIKQLPADKAVLPATTNSFRAELALRWLANGNIGKYKFYKATEPKFSYPQSLYLGYAVEQLFDDKKQYNDVEQISKALLKDLAKGTISDGIRPYLLMELNAAANAKMGNIEVAKEMLAKSSADKSSEDRLIKYFKDSQSNYLNRQAIVMLAAGENQGAYDLLEKAFRAAESNEHMVETFEEAYKKVKGSANGFDSYLKSLKKEAYQKYYKEVEPHYVSNPTLPINGTFPDPENASKKLVSFHAKTPVQNITMKNLDGQAVRLGDNKGKILVIDFWTTACTPCIAAFAGFGKVVNEYQKDKLQLFVVNIFQDNATVKAFAYQKPITLDVLQDEENTAYNVAATPSKIIFDSMGRIRFFSSGYAGSTDREYYKLKAMVEITMARNSVQTSSAFK